MLLGDGMARAYSSDLRIRVIGAVEGGFRPRGAGRRLGIGESTATAWMGRWRRTGSAVAKSQKGRSRSLPHTDWLLALIGGGPISPRKRPAGCWASAACGLA
jgi:transposase